MHIQVKERTQNKKEKFSFEIPKTKKKNSEMNFKIKVTAY